MPGGKLLNLPTVVVDVCPSYVVLFTCYDLKVGRDHMAITSQSNGNIVAVTWRSHGITLWLSAHHNPVIDQ